MFFYIYSSTVVDDELAPFYGSTQKGAGFFSRKALATSSLLNSLFNIRSIGCLNVYRWRSRLWTRANWTKATCVSSTEKSKY